MNKALYQAGKGSMCVSCGLWEAYADGSWAYRQFIVE